MIYIYIFEKFKSSKSKTILPTHLYPPSTNLKLNQSRYTVGAVSTAAAREAASSARTLSPAGRVARTSLNAFERNFSLLRLACNASTEAVNADRLLSSKGAAARSASARVATRRNRGGAVQGAIKFLRYARRPVA